MSDFFTRLAERTLGLTPTVQPVIPQVFAQVPAVSGVHTPGLLPDGELSVGLYADQSDTQEISQGFPKTANLPPLAPQVDLSSAEFINSDTESSFTERDENMSSHLETHDVRVETRIFNDSDLTLHPASLYTEPHPRKGGFSPLNRSIEDISFGVESVAVRSLPKREFGSDSPPERPPDARMESESESESESDLVRSGVSEKQVNVITAAAQNSVEPRITTRVRHKEMAPLKPPEEKDELPSASHSVRITIGRIEVRAILPPTAPPKRVSSAAPKMSLDDYLGSFKRDRK